MFFTRIIVTALSFGAVSLAAPIGAPLPVDGLLSGGSLLPGGSSQTGGSALPVVGDKLPIGSLSPLGGSGLPLPISGGAVPALGGSGAKLPLVGRTASTYGGALNNLSGVAGGFLSNLDAQDLDVASLLSGITKMNGALSEVSSVLGPIQGLGVDSLLAGASLDDVTSKTKSVFKIVNGVMTKVQAMELTSDVKNELLTTVKCLNEIISALGIAPELQAIAKGILSKVLGLVGGLLGGLGLGL
ncbi:hypothetical protein RSOLAG1IB_03265 [Rhizoctonia solani AG-1 IB]|uniref:Uncharacterized protein n=1 Tax=Thanatephorus cucumeris (strain AG1-IB / isolate 7/3/14) TaxID=1108050 RepID=A0A0B7FT06_THACB|nr:hypothetical protein RSOLAG1IB_03265 [Rhizoctonia solani AG-1 IB]